MRIVLVVDRFDPLAGGLEQWTVSFARFLLGRGHDVHVVAFSQGNHELPVTFHGLGWRRGTARRARLVELELVKLGPAIVHDTGTSWSGHVFHPQTGSRLLSQARLVATHPPLMRMRAALSPISIARRWQMAFVERRQVDRAKRIVAVSRLVRAQLVVQHGLPEERIAVIPNGVDTARFAPERLLKLRALARRRLCLGNSVVFLMSAHNLHLKGVDTAMRALAQLAVAGVDARLIVAGGRPDDFWHTLGRRLGIGERVSFLGHVAEIETLFAAADAMVHPSRWDACSLSTIEAGAAGLPAVTTAMNGASELIDDGRTGFVLADPEDTEALTTRMQELLNPDLRWRIGQAARKASVAHDIVKNLEAVEAILMEISPRQY